MPTIAIGLLTAFAATVLLLLATASYTAERRQVLRSLRTIRTSDVHGADFRAAQLAVPVTTRIMLPGVRRVGRGLRRFTPVSVIERLDQELQTAGSPDGWDGERFLAAKVLALGGVLAASVALTSILGLGLARGVPIIGFAAAMGYYLPEWMIRSQAGKRQAMMQRHLPDALDLLSITVEAGLGFDAALQRVSRQVEGPLGQEFHRIVQEMQLGKSRSDALRDLSDRTTVPELRSFVFAMVQADVFGIPIANVLAVQAREMRIKRRQRAEERAQKIPVKILGPLLLGIFPALMIIIIGPGAIQIRDTILR
jgi:tight adherence protein C